MRASARFVGPMDRILYLKSLPTLGDLPAHQLAPMAQFLEERNFRKGDVIIRDDRPVESVHFVTDGTVSVYFNGDLVARVNAPNGAGFLGLLSNLPGGTLAVAETDTMTLELAADVFVELMEENFGVYHQGLKQVNRQFLQARRLLPIREDDPPLELPEWGYPSEPLDLVQRLIYMRQRSGVFERCNMDALAELCRHQTELRPGPDTVMWESGDSSDFGFSIVYGWVRYTEPETGRVVRVGAGFSLGYPDCLAAQPRSYRATTETDCVLLRGMRTTMLDVLEDNFQMAVELMGSLCSTLLGIYSTHGPLD